MKLNREIDEHAFELVFREYHQLLCNYAYTFVRDKDEAEEIVQSVFLILWEKRSVLQVQQSVKAYLLGMVRNGSLNALKHNKVRQKQADEAKGAGEPTTQLALTDELEQRITVAMSQLPEQCRLVFQMSRMEDLKYTEIAGQLNISIKTVENHMVKALRIMRQYLRDYLMLLITALTQAIE